MLEKEGIAEETKEQEKEVFAEGDTGVEEEETLSDEIIKEPFDPTQIRVTSNIYSIDLLCTRIKKGELDLQPEFQRKAGIWKDGAQSRLTESMLIRIPLPAFYIDGTDDECWLVVDGLHKIVDSTRYTYQTKAP